MVRVGPIEIPAGFVLTLAAGIPLIVAVLPSLIRAGQAVGGGLEKFGEGLGGVFDLFGQPSPDQCPQCVDPLFAVKFPVFCLTCGGQAGGNGGGGDGGVGGCGPCPDGYIPDPAYGGQDTCHCIQAGQGGNGGDTVDEILNIGVVDGVPTRQFARAITSALRQAGFNPEGPTYERTRKELFEAAQGGLSVAEVREILPGKREPFSIVEEKFIRALEEAGFNLTDGGHLVSA